jgi:ATP-dependent DNA helicase RecQ
VDNLYSTLKETFGFDEFRANQKESIEAILKNRDVLTLLPTGGGKSLCYQLPALLKNGCAIVISPLIALINDQVSALRNLGIKADKVTSNQSSQENSEVIKSLLRGELKLLYLSPERITNESFLDILSNVNISFFVVDEAHCISEWGHEFRDDYRNLSILRDKFPNISIAAFTATATPKVIEDIAKNLHLKNHLFLKGSFFRNNLILNVMQRPSNAKGYLLKFLSKYRNESGIIYTFTRKESEDIANFLIDNGVNAEAYHAGLDKHTRDKVQDKFLKDNIQIVVATVAFGMGIDKSNVRFVVHTSMPKSIEGYYQEIGRAGRDGLISECLLMFNRNDMTRKFSLMNDLEEKYQVLAYNKLKQMYSYTISTECRHKYLAKYFNENIKECDDKCDNCLSESEMLNFTKEAQMFLSTVYRVNQNFGLNYVIDVLRGSKNQKLIDNAHQNLSVYGIGKEKSKNIWKAVGDKLLTIEAIFSGEYKELKLTPLGVEILKGQKDFFIQSSLVETKKDISLKQEDLEVDKEIFNKLRAVRYKISMRENIPAYIVFNDSTIKEMAMRLPKTKDEMMSINGVGEVKFERYGEEFLEGIKNIK